MHSVSKTEFHYDMGFFCQNAWYDRVAMWDISDISTIQRLLNFTKILPPDQDQPILSRATEENVCSIHLPYTQQWEVKKDSFPPFLVRMEGVQQGKIVLSKFPTYRDVQNIEKSHLQHFLLP